MALSILHPSRSRPDKSFETIDKWISNSCGGDVEVIVSLDSDDPLLNKYYLNFGKAAYKVTFLVNDNKSAVDAINKAAAISSGHIMIVVSDDTDCPKCWNFDLEFKLKGKSDFIAKCGDGIQKWIITMPVLDRAYYNRFGYVYHPDYLHMFCDTELSCVADLTGRRVEIDMNFPHNHYSIGKSKKDSISDKADKTWTQGEALFLNRMRKKFELKETVGKISDSSYLNWAKSKGVTI